MPGCDDLSLALPNTDFCRNYATSMPGMDLSVSGPFQINLCGETCGRSIAAWGVSFQMHFFFVATRSAMPLLTP